MNDVQGSSASPGSDSWAQADDKMASAITSFWEELDEDDRTFFVFFLTVVAFVWYGLILGMAWMED